MLLVGKESGLAAESFDCLAGIARFPSSLYLVNLLYLCVITLAWS